ncbi:MAG TPA: protein kinase [Gemmatimonadales bacterium]|nr:protein kinase [Gemmatimonadales bacterium]
MPADLARFAAALADRYRIERELGQGGMATVYLAHDLKHDRQVAVKVLRPELAAVIGAERFLAEIRTTASLQHPHILPLFDSGAVDASLYYVMPFVQGESLRDRLEREKQLPVAEAVRIAREVGGALDYAHRQGVIHRDIKPENILLSEGSALVADFGIALAMSGAGGARMTETGMSLGTPSYMSPEQAMGERALDARSDIFSLGCVLYEMLLGEPPFTGATAQAIVAKVMTADAPSLTAQRRTIPPALDRVVHRALERVPADRYDTAAEFVAALAAGAGAGEQAGPAASRGRGWVGPAAAALVLALGAGAFFLLRGRAGEAGHGPGANRRIVAVLPFRNISRDTAQQYFSAGMTEELTTQLARIAALRVLGRAATAQYDTAGNRLERMARELGVGSVVDGSVRLAGDRVRIGVELTDVKSGQTLWSEQYDRQLADLFAVQDDVARKVSEALQARLTTAESRRVAHVPTTSMAAYQLYLRALDLHPTRRTENLTRAELLRQALGLDPRFAAARAQLARNYMFRGVGGEPAWLDSGFVAARAAIALDPELADGYFALGDLQSYRFAYADARRSYLKALELNPSHDGVMSDLANVYVSLGQYDEALNWALRSVQLNPNHPHGPYHVGLPLIALGDDSATGRYLRHAEQRRPTELRIQGLLSWLELREGRRDAAMARARRLVRNEPDNTEGPPILAELAVITGAPDAEPLMKALAEQDPEGVSQYSAAGLRSFHALTLHRRGADRQADSLWRQSAAAAERSLAAGAEGPAAPMELAAINAIEGHTKEAMDWLERGYQAGWKDARQLEIDPFFDSVRREPRFQAVLAGMRQDLARMRARAASAHPEIFAEEAP